MNQLYPYEISPDNWTTYVYLVVGRDSQKAKEIVADVLCREYENAIKDPPLSLEQIIQTLRARPAKEAVLRNKTVPHTNSLYMLYQNLWDLYVDCRAYNEEKILAKYLA